MVAGIKGMKGAKVRARARRARAVGFDYWLSKINAHLDQWQYNGQAIRTAARQCRRISEQRRMLNER